MGLKTEATVFRRHQPEFGIGGVEWPVRTYTAVFEHTDPVVEVIWESRSTAGMLGEHTLMAEDVVSVKMTVNQARHLIDVLEKGLREVERKEARLAKKREAVTA